jgi:hypothetical protein
VYLLFITGLQVRIQFSDSDKLVVERDATIARMNEEHSQVRNRGGNFSLTLMTCLRFVFMAS